MLEVAVQVWRVEFWFPGVDLRIHWQFWREDEPARGLQLSKNLWLRFGICRDGFSESVNH